MSKYIPTQQKPLWIDARNVYLMYGIGKTTLYKAEADRKIRSVSMREPGKKRGKKLWNVASIDEWIEKMEKLE
jgi:predicted DNA-binding transcriptional regulator AlpA